MLNKKVKPLFIFAILVSFLSCVQDDADITFSDQEFFTFNDVVYSIENSTYAIDILDYSTDTSVAVSYDIEIVSDTSLVEEEDTATCVDEGGDIGAVHAGTGVTARVAGFIPDLFECIEYVDDTTFIYDTTFNTTKISLYTITLVSDEYSVELAFPLETDVDSTPVIEEITTLDITQTTSYTYTSTSTQETKTVNVPSAFFTVQGLLPDYATSGFINILSLDEENNINLTFSLIYHGISLVGKYEGPIYEID